jgi:FtsP/CotA-like multicopper oxidase with cupredoxin domain
MCLDSTPKIHLHGHDFAILAQGTNYSALVANNITMNFQNPPRRDVALLPAAPGLGGYLIIAFKADNPGVWLVHCHIGTSPLSLSSSPHPPV